MSGTPDLLNLFIEPSVALLYFMSVVVLSYAALFMALGQRMRGPAERGAGRYAVASLGVALAWMVLMIGAMAVLVTEKPVTTILPPLDRAISASVILLVGWAFLTARQPAPMPPLAASLRRRADKPKPTAFDRIINVVTIVMALIIVGGYAYTAINWYNLNVNGFNQSVYGLGWLIGTTVLTVVVLLLHVIRFRSTVDAPLKMIFFLLVLAGYVFTLVSVNNGTLHGDDSGAIRLAFLAAIPFLPVVIYRFVVDRLSTVQNLDKSQVTEAASQAMAAMANAERDTTSILKSLGLMLERESPEELPQQIVIAIAQSLKADVTALLALDDAEYADVISTYDNIQHKPIAALALKLDEQPTVQAAIEDRKQRTLTTEVNLNELVDLYTRLDIKKIGPAYIQPLAREGTTVGVVIVALPYTQRQLRDTEMRLLESMGPMAARLLAISRSAQRSKTETPARVLPEGMPPEPPVSAARAEMQASLEIARAQINELSSRVRDLQIELDFERSRISELGANDPEGLTITQRMEKMSNERAQLEAEREKLVQALREAETQLASISGDDEQIFGTMVRVLEQERDELQAQKNQLEAELREIRSQGATPIPTVLRDMLTRLSEEKARLSVERDQVKAQLSEVEAQLSALGIEGGSAGLASVIVQLTDERSYYKAQAERSAQERDTLIQERKKLEQQIAHESARDNQITALESDLRRLAEEREVLQRQRDALRQERGAVIVDRDKLQQFRAKVVSEITKLQTDLSQALFDRNKAAAERDELASSRANWSNERDRLLAERTALQTERDQLLARIEGNRETLQRLGADGVGALKNMIDQLTEERSELEHKLLKMQSKMQKTQEQLTDAENKLARSVQVPPSTSVDASNAEVMLSISQELRTPLSSIVAYVDLLLGESVGILGALQRQFLQRVKANADRLAGLVEDFVRITAIDTGQLNLKPEHIDMTEVVDDAINATRTQFREKGITLGLDIPEQLPRMTGDRDALQQIIIQLLSNAYLASPTDSEVTITARFEPKYKIPARNGNKDLVADSIYIAVKDNGGGVPPEEQERVFSRLYRADNPLIQGLGDTGVGLSIARALTEAHGGRIWMESVPGVSSTFKLVLPVQGMPQPERMSQIVS